MFLLLIGPITTSLTSQLHVLRNDLSVGSGNLLLCPIDNVSLRWGCRGAAAGGWRCCRRCRILLILLRVPRSPNAYGPAADGQGRGSGQVASTSGRRGRIPTDSAPRGGGWHYHHLHFSVRRRIRDGWGERRWEEMIIGQGRDLWPGLGTKKPHMVEGFNDEIL